MSRSRVIIFKGAISELDFKTDIFIDYLVERQIDHYVVDVSKPWEQEGEALVKFLRQGDCIMFSYNDLGIDTKYDGKNLWKTYGIPAYTFLVDHPRNFHDALLEPPCDVYCICCDKDHVSFVKEYYEKVKGAFFVPQGGFESSSIIPASKRKIDVIYMGSCKGEVKEFAVTPVISGFADEFYSFCIGRMFDNPSLSTEECIKSYFKENGLAITKQQLFELYITVSVDIEKYVRRRYQLSGIHALDKAGIHVEIYGNHDRWYDEEEPFSDNIVVHERVPVRELLKILGDSKISLCFSPWFKKGCSEKPLDSLINRALCVSDESEYVKEKYTDGENIIFFDLNNPAQMAQDVKWLLEHPTVMDAIADKGYETALLYDKWDIRYDQICGIMGLSVAAR
jgi:hypothetical protein